MNYVKRIYRSYREAQKAKGHKKKSLKLRAIRAAIYPKFTDYNYFLNRLDTGETVFSATYDEHVRNKNRYIN